VNELVEALAMSGTSSAFGYGGTLSTAVPLDNDVSEELVPYRSLDPGRLKLSGSGQWQCDRFMGDLFKMVKKPAPPKDGIPLLMQNAPDLGRRSKHDKDWY